MMKLVYSAVIALAAAAMPAHAGTTEQALARCTAAAQSAAPGAAVTVRKIVEGGRQTSVSLWVKDGEKRAFDCAIGVHGEVSTAFAKPAGKAELATAE